MLSRELAHERAISIHALRGEGDLFSLPVPVLFASFLSTPSAGRATCSPKGSPLRNHSFLSTPSAGRATSLDPLHMVLRLISIHALRGEGDPAPRPTIANSVLFLSTPSAGRATRIDVADGLAHLHFYPRPPRGGRRELEPIGFLKSEISIHALRGEGDLVTGLLYKAAADFYPRPPRGGRLPGPAGSSG